MTTATADTQRELAPGGGMPAELQPARLRRSIAIVMGALVILVLIALLAPGLGDVRDALAGASAGGVWGAGGVGGGSCPSLRLLFPPRFFTDQPRVPRP